jgi:lipoprotein-anchoring transpeptidase ErfK/SrfK
VKRVSLLLTIVAGLSVAGVLASAPPAADPPPGTTTTVPAGPIAAGVTIAGVDVGGLTRDAAAAAVQEAFETPLELVLGSTRVLVTPDVLGAVPAIDKALDKALTAPPDTAVPLAVVVSGEKIAAFVSRLAQRFDRPAVDSKLFLRHLRPWLSKERPGRKLGQRRAVREITAALVGGVRETIRLTQTKLRPKVTRKNFGAVIVIRRDLNRLLLYDGMRYRRLFGVATGQSRYPTPLGRFRIVVKWKNPWWYPPNSPWAQGQKPIPPGPDNPLGTRWMGLSAPGVGIHGTPSDASIGYSVSHGCIRMHIPEAEWLFNHVEIGTTVFIVSAR